MSPAGRAVAPRATYRFQVHAGFGLDDVLAALPHLDRLSISHVHLSPITQARPGSTHGYDVTDSSALSEEIGGEAALARLHAGLAERGMGLLLDIVPNHEAAHPLNARWQDVLRHGAASAHASRYDIDWERGGGKILRPVLGRPFGASLEAGELRLAAERDELVVRCEAGPLPLDPATWPVALGEAPAGEPPAITRALADLTAETSRLPARTESDPDILRVRRDLVGRAGARLAALREDPSGAHAIDARLDRLRGVPGEPASFDALEELIRLQAWRLSSWKAAAEDVNYRRFFDISDLVGVRAEDPAIFEATHALPLDLARRGIVTGFRIDHVDGLREPREYLERLAARLAEATDGRGFIVVEKILSGTERLPEDWPVFGTTGYETLNGITGALVAPEGLRQLDASYRARTGRDRDLRQTCHRRKAQAMRELLSGDERRLVLALHVLARADRHACDVTRSDLRTMLGALTAALGAYRTYREAGREATAQERALITEAARVASAGGRTEAQRRALEFIVRCLVAPLPERDADLTRLVLRWQQFTGPVMAKGLEDTAFYVHVPLLAVNEVGGDLGGGAAFAGEEAFHERMLETLRSGRPGLAPTSTHDTKRGEDARARLALLAEMPGRWAGVMEQWRLHEPALQRLAKGRVVPDANERELIAQSLLGAWPAQREARWQEPFLERFLGFMTKAMREAKTHTSWIAPDDAHEAALLAHVRDLMGHADAEPLASFAVFADEVAQAAVAGSLAQAVLRCTGPAAPEIYQGSQAWNHALVDPDNRRPVDHALLEEQLRDIVSRFEADGPALASGLLDRWQDGRVKLLVTWASLRARASEPELFARGEHVPLRIDGLDAGGARALGFARVLAGRAALVLLPLGGLGPAWASGRPLPCRWEDARVSLPPGLPETWVHALTGRRLSTRGGSLRALDAWADLPAALLMPA